MSIIPDIAFDYPLLESVNRDRTFLLGLDCSSAADLINRRRQRIDYDYNNYATNQRLLAIARIINERDFQKEVFSAIKCPVLQTSGLTPEIMFAKALALYKDFASKHPLARQIDKSALPNIPKFMQIVSGGPPRDV